MVEGFINHRRISVKVEDAEDNKQEEAVISVLSKYLVK